MQPTKAPWASGTSLHDTSMHVVAGGALDSRPPPNAVPSALPHTGVPVKAKIEVDPQLPEVQPSRWPTTWEAAKKRIVDEDGCQQALKSEALRRFVAFTLALNQSVQDKRLSDECHVSPAVQRLVDVLERLSRLCDDIPPAQQSLRYGNPSYRKWFEAMQRDAPESLYDLLGDSLAPALVEILPYFLDSFGNFTRIDYGTGHETNFVAFLYCLFALGVLGAEDQQATVTRVFHKYLELMRKIQTSYWLEPAGSHGVWGLDDYQFFPFIWGSSQLLNHPHIKPKSILNDDILDSYGGEFLYLNAVRFVKSVKKGPLHETSPMLYDISGVPTWSKVNTGMLKMYQVELLSKFPIMQHFLFGTLLPYP